MSPSRPISRSFAALGLAAGMALCLGVSACSSSGAGAGTAGGGHGTSSGKSSLYDAKIAAELPASIRKKGSVTIGTSADYAPVEFVGSDGSTIIGIDPDLAKAIMGVLGLKYRMANSSYDSLTPSLSAGRYDMLMAGVEDVKQREKTDDFVDYMQMGTLFYVKAQGGSNITSLSGLCGHSAAMERGTTQQIDAEKQNKKCGGNVKVEVYPNQNEVNLAVQSGRADVGMADSAPVLYQVKKSNGAFKVSGKPYALAKDGIVVPKGSPLVKPLTDAVNKLIADGQYAAILKKWGVQSVAVKQATVNGATF